MIPLLTLARTPLENGWVETWNEPSLAAFEANAHRFREVMPEWTTVAPDGTALRVDGQTAEQRSRIFKAAHGAKVRVFGTASNYGDTDFDPVRVSAFLRDPAKRTLHASGLAGIAREDGLDGIDLDYESIKAEDRDLFSDFVRQLAGMLHKDGKKVSVTVHSKESEPGGWDGPQSEDWKALGKAADVVRVMTYDQHWSASEAGPIAADDWVIRVMRFAKTQVPAGKLEMGLAAYGYDWNESPAKSLAWPDFTSKTAVLDPGSGELVDGKLRFSGAAAYRRKRAIAQKLGLRGTAMWYIGSGEPSMWTR